MVAYKRSGTDVDVITTHVFIFTALTVLYNGGSTDVNSCGCGCPAIILHFNQTCQVYKLESQDEEDTVPLSWA